MPAPRRGRREMLGEMHGAWPAAPFALRYVPPARGCAGCRPEALRGARDESARCHAAHAMNLRKPGRAGGSGHAVHV